jgi:hypothetical protein
MNGQMKESPRNKTDKKMSWSDVKKALADYGRTELIGLIADLYAAHSTNKNFLHARFSKGSAALKPYLKIIEDALYPDIYENKPVQIAKGKKAISDYRKAVGDPKGILELMLCFVENGTQFTLNCGDMDEDFYDSLLRMYDNAIDMLLTMDDAEIAEYRPRFEYLVTSTAKIGWGYHDALEEIFGNAFPDEED